VSSPDARWSMKPCVSKAWCPGSCAARAILRNHRESLSVSRYDETRPAWQVPPPPREARRRAPLGGDPSPTQSRTRSDCWSESDTKPKSNSPGFAGTSTARPSKRGRWTSPCRWRRSRPILPHSRACGRRTWTGMPSLTSWPSSDATSSCGPSGHGRVSRRMGKVIWCGGGDGVCLE
jgi:hypothetical protein